MARYSFDSLGMDYKDDKSIIEIQMPQLLALQMFTAIYRRFAGILVYRDFRIVGVTCSMGLPQIIIEIVSSNIIGGSCCRNAIEKSHLSVG